ncbi:hypothetical protein LY13_002911 [Prauserella aidingensis]|nr:hypothetical protein [Prauserella aidingensis]
MTTPDPAGAATTVTSAAPRLRVLLWHVHGSWTDAFVRGRHHYLLPVDEERGPWGRGTAGREWPAAEEVPTAEVGHAEPDVVVLQRPEEVAQAERLTGLRPGRDVPAVYVEHNAPRPNPAESRHPLADRDDIPIVHVTHYNRAMSDNGIAPTQVVGHGIPDPGHRYTGGLAAGVSMLNEPVRRRRVGGSDLLADLSEVGPVDVFGIGTGELGDTGPLRGLGDVPPPRLPAHGPLDVAGSLTARGDAPRDARRRLREYRGADVGPARCGCRVGRRRGAATGLS